MPEHITIETSAETFRIYRTQYPKEDGSFYWVYLYFFYKQDYFGKMYWKEISQSELPHTIKQMLLNFADKC